MRNTINIDIGGTFTDSYVVHGDHAVRSKVLTTRYNLGVGFSQAITACAEQLDLTEEELLSQTDMVRYATTVAMNALLERKGPKLGLITTTGHEDTIHIGRGAQWHDHLPPEMKRVVARSRRPTPLIPRELVAGVNERISAKGDIVVPLNRKDVLNKVQYLVDRGVMGFIVSLMFAHVNPIHEQMIRDIIKEEYPDVYLGAVPVLLSSEVLPKQNEYQRTMTAVLDGYLHRAMADELIDLGVSLREKGYTKPLYIVHTSGGCAPLQQTAGVNTYAAGPVGGLLGAQHLIAQYGLKNAVVTDMGGTSFDMGLVVDGQVNSYQFTPLVEEWRVGISMIETKSVGAGGGSIAWVNEALGNWLQVGPQSAGSNPGPACFDMGGEEPTVTDADVVLGYINPDYFLGGRFPLNPDKAVEAVRRKIAEPLGLSVEDAALAIRKIIDANMGNELFKEVNLRGHDPRKFTLVAYGGGGPAHCCGYAKYLGTPRIFTVPQASVFSAYGISVTDFATTYEASRQTYLHKPATQEYLTDYEFFNSAVRTLQQRALMDMNLKDANQVVFGLELEIRYGQQPNSTRINSPRLTLNSKEDVKAVCQAFEQRYAQLYGAAAAFPIGGIELMGLMLRATMIMPKQPLPTFELSGPDPAAARRGTRRCYWEEGWVDTPVYGFDALKCGNRVEGPAIIEAQDTTYVIPRGYTYHLDQHRTGIIEGV